MNLKQIQKTVLEEEKDLNNTYHFFNVPDNEVEIGEEHHFKNKEPAHATTNQKIRFNPEWLKEENPRERQIRRTARHELAHLLHRDAQKGKGYLGKNYNGCRAKDIEKAPLEAFAQYEGSMANKENQAYRPINIGKLPDFYINEIASKENPNEPSDPHQYGAMAAQLIEMSYRQNHGLEKAQEKTREELLDSPSFQKGHKALENKVVNACNRLEIPYIKDIYEEEQQKIEEKYENGQTIESNGQKLELDPEEALENTFKESSFKLQGNGGEPDYETYCRAKAQLNLLEDEMSNNRWYVQVENQTNNLMNQMSYIDPDYQTIHPKATI